MCVISRDHVRRECDSLANMVTELCSIFAEIHQQRGCACAKVRSILRHDPSVEVLPKHPTETTPLLAVGEEPERPVPAHPACFVQLCR